MILLALFLIGCSKKEADDKPQNITILSEKYAIKDIEALQPLTTEEKLEDFEYLYKMVEENYPYLEVIKRKYGYDWMDKKELHSKLIRNSKDLDDFIRIIDNILRKLKNGHTRLVSSAEEYDDLVYYASSTNNNPWLSVLKQDSVVDRYNNMRTEEKLDIIKNKEVEVDRYGNLQVEILEDDTIGYIKVNSFDKQFIGDDEEILKAFYSKIKDFPYLIIDIRGNGGGSDMYWMSNIVSSLTPKKLESQIYALIRGDGFDLYTDYYFDIFSKGSINKIKSMDEIKSKPNLPPEANFDYFDYALRIDQSISPIDSINYEGKIYILVDDKVASASESFTVFAKSTNFAEIIGTQTRGDGIGFTQLYFSLPNSNLIVKLSSNMGLNPDGSSNEEFGTIPDVPTRSSLEALDKALELIELDKKNK